jgi:hypothetical protein
MNRNNSTNKSINLKQYSEHGFGTDPGNLVLICLSLGNADDKGYF